MAMISAPSSSSSSSASSSSSPIFLPPKPICPTSSKTRLVLPCRHRPTLIRCRPVFAAINPSSPPSPPSPSPSSPRRTASSSFTVSSASGSDQTLPSKEDEDGEVSVGCYDRAVPRSPSPEIDPRDVVYAQLRALQARDLATVFEFASPKNKSHTGPLSKFSEMIQGRAYNIMLGHATAEVLSTLNVTPERFQQRVLITDVNGRQTTFSWSLSKQDADPYQGCWMTDSVHRDD